MFHVIFVLVMEIYILNCFDTQIVLEQTPLLNPAGVFSCSGGFSTEFESAGKTEKLGQKVLKLNDKLADRWGRGCHVAFEVDQERAKGTTPAPGWEGGDPREMGLMQTEKLIH